MLRTLLLALVVASWAYWLVALLLIHFFFHSHPEGAPSFQPPVSILKPVRGLDAQADENFASFCEQDYPDFEILFGVMDPDDPVVPAIERLQRDYPDREIRLLIAPTGGSNRKVSILQHLAVQARHEIMVISDSDMRVTPDYLHTVVAPLAEANVGLVTCAYHGLHACTVVAGLEALHMGVTFLPSVLVARKVLGMRFAMGATVALRQKDLQRMGGFAAIADHLADDFQLAVRMAKLGCRVVLSRYVTASVLGRTDLRTQWEREVRWARGLRICRPREYPGLLLSFATPLATAFLLASGLAPMGWYVLGASLLWRWLVAWLVTGYTGDGESRRWLIWLPVRDYMSALVWIVGGVGRRIRWRGEEFVLQARGRMKAASDAAGGPVEVDPSD